MTASTDAATAMPTEVAAANFAFDQPLLSNGRHFSTGDYHAARRYIDRTSHGFFDFSLQRAREFRQYDVRSARLGDTRFNLVQVDSVSGYDIEMMNIRISFSCTSSCAAARSWQLDEGRCGAGPDGAARGHAASTSAGTDRPSS